MVAPNVAQHVYGRGSWWLALGVVVALTLPVLVVSYPPMTDYPQHYAATSILVHLDEPRWGYARFYERALGRTPYLLSYLFPAGLSFFLPLEWAMRITAWLSAALYPLGVLAILRALRKPAWLALVAAPIVYNRAVFWGLLASNLSMGLALLAIALFIPDERTWKHDVGLAILASLISVTHLFGLAVLLGYVVLWAVLADARHAWKRRLLAVSPTAAGVVAWLWMGKSARSVGEPVNPLVTERLLSFESNVLGGYKDASEAILLATFLLVVLALAAPRFPWGWRRWARLPLHDRVLYAYVAVGLNLYLILPTNTGSMKVMNLRLAVLALALLPLAVPADAFTRFTRPKLAIVSLLATFAIANAWVHWLRFDREAKSFDAVLQTLPPRPDLLSLTVDTDGDIMRSHPYVHFAAYAQAERGGFISMSFASLAWTSPVRQRDRDWIPEMPATLEWNPRLYDYDDFGYFFDYALVRGISEEELRDIPDVHFPFERVASEPPWWVYRQVREK